MQVWYGMCKTVESECILARAFVGVSPPEFTQFCFFNLHFRALF